MKSIKNTEKKLALSKLNKSNKNYEVKTLDCPCYICPCQGFAQAGGTSSVFRNNIRK